MGTMPTAKMPALRPERIVRALVACGLVVKRQRGSHTVLSKPGLRRPVIVAMHGRELPQGHDAYAGSSSAALSSSIAAVDRASHALNSFSPRSFAKSSVPSEMTTYTSTYNDIRRYSRQHCSKL